MIPELAARRAAARDLFPGTSSSLPSSLYGSHFSVLARDMVPRLAEVAADSGIVFRGEKGPPLEEIFALCAKERLEGALAEARAFTAWAEPSPLVHSEPSHRETRDDGAPPVEGGIVTPLVGLPSVRVPRGRPPTRLNPTETRSELGGDYRLWSGWSCRSEVFLTELKNKVERCSTPVVVAGDFNLIRWAFEKSSSNVDRGRMRMFNDCIGDLALWEIARVGARFTWTNKQEDPIQSVLDRVFVSPQWEFMFPLSSLKVVTRIGSDHTPLPFSSWEGAAPMTRRSRFETFWLEHTGFCELMRERWRAAAASVPRVFCAVDVWHHCAKLTRQAMKGWGANLGADLRARKGALLDQIQVLDILADGPGLSPDDWIRRYSLEASLMCIYESEELFWQRRGGHNWLLKGDANTAYFEAIANGRRRKCAIPFLWDGETLLEIQEDISSHVYSLYKSLFLGVPWGGVSLCVDFWAPVDRVSDSENAALTLPFPPEEVRLAIASMKTCSAPGPDGLPVVFFQKFRELLRPVIIPMFRNSTLEP
ncbi:hypothetical protein D1007_34782 [Hordeum vulgare]|nr:hypothetical protein D1007_34782 [Hordeum vulgare]